MRIKRVTQQHSEEQLEVHKTMIVLRAGVPSESKCLTSPLVFLFNFYCAIYPTLPLG